MANSLEQEWQNCFEQMNDEERKAVLLMLNA